MSHEQMFPGRDDRPTGTFERMYEGEEDTKPFPPDPGEEEESDTLDDHLDGDPNEAEEDVSIQDEPGDEGEDEEEEPDVPFSETEHHEE